MKSILALAVLAFSAQAFALDPNWVGNWKGTSFVRNEAGNPITQCDVSLSVALNVAELSVYYQQSNCGISYYNTGMPLNHLVIEDGKIFDHGVEVGIYDTNMIQFKQVLFTQTRDFVAGVHINPEIGTLYYEHAAIVGGNTIVRMHTELTRVP